MMGELQRTSEELRQPPADSAVATWENEGGSVIVPPDGRNELELTRLSSVRVDSKPSGVSTSSETNDAADMANYDTAALPPEIADRFTKPLGRFSRSRLRLASGCSPATCAALILSNSAWSTPFLSFWETPFGFRFGSFDFSRSLRHWINDGLMTLFFFVVALGLKRELVLGELRGWRKAALSFAAALGGMLVPASIL